MAVGRSRLARVIGPILIFLGALLITAALAGPLYVADKLKVIPLDTDITTVAQSVLPTDSGANPDFPARALDLCSVNAPRAVVNDVTLTTQTRTVVVQPSDSGSMTVQSGTSMVIPSIRTDGEPRHPQLTNSTVTERPCDDGLMQAWVDRVSLDRISAAPNGGTSEAVFSPGESTAPIALPDRTGLQYRFPAGVSTDNGTYSYFDMITRQNVPLEFVENQEVSGTDTVLLRGTQDWVDLSTIRDGNDPTLGTVLTMPAGWWGIGGVDPDDSITLNRWARTEVSLWVDPESGIITDEAVHYVQEFRLPAQVGPETPQPIVDFSLTVFDAQQRWVDDTVRSQAEAAKSEQNQIAIARYVVPIAGGLLGLIALVLGAFALFQGRRGAGAGSAGGSTGAGSGGGLFGRTDPPTRTFDDDAASETPTDVVNQTPRGPGSAPASPADDAATEAFTAQPRPDESATEALDLRKRDQR